MVDLTGTLGIQRIKKGIFEKIFDKIIDILFEIIDMLKTKKED